MCIVCIVHSVYVISIGVYVWNVYGYMWYVCYVCDMFGTCSVCSIGRGVWCVYACVRCICDMYVVCVSMYGVYGCDTGFVYSIYACIVYV